MYKKHFSASDIYATRVCLMLPYLRGIKELMAGMCQRICLAASISYRGVRAAACCPIVGSNTSRTSVHAQKKLEQDFYDKRKASKVPLSYRWKWLFQSTACVVGLFSFYLRKANNTCSKMVCISWEVLWSEYLLNISHCLIFVKLLLKLYNNEK